MLELNKIYCIDVLDGLKQLLGGSIDLIITSPPYNLGNNHHTGNKRHKTYDNNKNEKEYQEWQIKVINECFRVLKDNGSMVYNHKNRIKDGMQITPYEWILKTKFIVKQEIVWINQSQNFDRIRFYPWIERLCWLTKSPKIKLTNTLNKCDVFDWTAWKPVGTRKEHKSAFPEKMVEDIISVFPDAKIVLDPFIGGGTTAVVAKRLGKKFIGFEIDEKFVSLANERVFSSIKNK